jgi:hypothetical protein
VWYLVDLLRKIFSGPDPIVVQPEAPVQEPKREEAVQLEPRRPFRLTFYVIAEQDGWAGPQDVPVLGPDGEEIARVQAGFFCDMNLQGTGKLDDGRLLNVHSWVPCRHEDYASVMERHDKIYQNGNPYPYSGIRVKDGKVYEVRTLRSRPQGEIGEGYGVIRGIPLVPFRTLAADIGALPKADPQWKGKGGLVPPRTRVHIEEFMGVELPDGTVHDGWFTVNDTGGAIYGAHFDVFVGTRTLRKNVMPRWPERGSVWYEGIAERVPEGYTYGLNK